MPSFATVQDVSDRLGRTFDATEQTQVQSYLDAATAIIRAQTGQTIEEVDPATLNVWGRPGERLPLPQRPVTAVTSVTLDGTLVDPSEYLLRKSELVRAVGWGTELQTLVIVYKHGFNPIPELIKNTSIDVATRGFTLAAAGGGAIRSERIGSYSVTYRSDRRQDVSGASVWLGESELKMLRRFLGISSGASIYQGPGASGASGAQPPEMVSV
jgi:hypothetical protein